MPDYEINTFAELCQRIIDSDGKGRKENVGDEVRQVVSITATRDFDFVSLSMPRPACFEPKAFTSGYTALGDLSGYRAIGDTQTRFFVDRLPKGSYTLGGT